MNSAAMNYKFLVRDLKQDRTITLKVAAYREESARRELRLAGFQPLTLVGVEARNNRSLETAAGQAQNSGSLGHLRVRFSTMVSEFFAPFNLLAI
ncbi:MAG: hypothetical protein WC314_04020 [Vulcanimicrobiota bacterium]